MPRIRFGESKTTTHASLILSPDCDNLHYSILAFASRGRDNPIEIRMTKREAVKLFKDFLDALIADPD